MIRVQYCSLESCQDFLRRLIKMDYIILSKTKVLPMITFILPQSTVFHLVPLIILTIFIRLMLKILYQSNYGILTIKLQQEIICTFKV